MARFRLELGPVPLHHQVYLDLLSSLDAGRWPAGDQLPTERDLATHYGCSLITVRRALDNVANEVIAPKHNKARTIPISPRLAAVLAALPRRGLWVLAPRR